MCTPSQVRSYGTRCFNPDAGALSGTVAQFYGQTGLAINKAGSLFFVADTDDQIVRQIYCSKGTGNFCVYFISFIFENALSQRIQFDAWSLFEPYNNKYGTYI